MSVVQMAFNLQADLALTIKPNRCGEAISRSDLIKQNLSIYLGICRKLGGRFYLENLEILPSAFYILEGDKYSLHSHWVVHVPQVSVENFAKTVTDRSSGSIIKKHDPSATVVLKKITSAGWVNYCTKNIKTCNDMDNLVMLTPEVLINK